MKKSWEDEYSIPFGEVDIKKEVFLPTLWNLMQETAWNHATHLKLGYSDLAEQQYFWVLSRLSIQMEEYPQWGDRIKIKTWLTGMGRLFALRQFSIAGSTGNILGTAKSAWLVLDLKSRKPQKIGPLFKRVLPLLDRPAEAEEPEKIPDVVHPREENFFKVRYSDIDMHHHVNNTKYMEWILDRAPFEMHRQHHVQTFVINFLAESSHGDEISIHSETYGDSPLTFLHSVFRKNDGRELCRAKVKWKQIDSNESH